MLLGSSIVTRLGLVLLMVAAGCSAADGPAIDGGSAAGDGAADVGPVARDAATTDAPTAPAGDASAASTCQRDEDCQLVNDCCTCDAIPRGEKAPVCDPKRVCVT